MYLLRSLLFMPGNKQKLLNKIPTVTADAVVLDLEDSVPLAEKSKARELIGNAIKSFGNEKVKIFVRTNNVNNEIIIEDLNGVVMKGLDGLVLPKIESAGEVRLVSRLLGLLEEKNNLEFGSIKLIPTIETALGLLRASDITGSSERVIAISWGAEDYTLDLGIKRTKEGKELYFPRALLANTAAAYKVQCLDTVFTDFNDEDGLIEEVRQIKQLGFHGKYLIHPKQIEPVNRGFMPTEEEISFSKKVVEAFDKAQKENLGVIAVDGKMVDPPVVEKAKRIMAIVKESNSN